MFIRRGFSSCAIFSQSSKPKRPSSWALPDLDQLPGGFRGKVYNKKDWTEYLTKNTAILKNGEDHEIEPAVINKNLKPPPKGWRKKTDLPMWMRNKYALREKQIKEDLSNVKTLSPKTAHFIRVLHDQFPNELNTQKLADFFKVSPISISKILKSRWTPTKEQFEKLEKRWQRKITKQVSQKLLESKFNEFIEETEHKIKMEIPPFLKQKLYDIYKLEGIESVREDFADLEEARIEREKIKDEKVVGYINAIPGKDEKS